MQVDMKISQQRHRIEQNSFVGNIIVQLAPNEKNRRRAILQELLGTCSEMTGIEPDFHCDYGFNIHMHGLVIINCNCVILNTSPVNIGTGTFIATGVPCKVIRPITEKDKIAPEGFCFEHTDFVFVSMN